MRETGRDREKIFSVTIHDCEVQTFRAGGKGGQNQNKRDTGVRVIHPPSGARGESREERSQLQNKQRAFRRMAESREFDVWLRRTMGLLAVESEAASLRAVGELANLGELEHQVKIEVRKGGQWAETSSDQLT